MGSFARRAGSGRLTDGRLVTWTVADGRRGRRWRSATSGADGRLVQALLLEIAPDGRVSRLEVAGPAGLLVLHPDPDESTLHGNVVRTSGVEHVALPWSPAHVLLVGSSPVTAVVAASRLARDVGVGEGASIPAIEVGEDLSVRRATWRVARVGPRRWWLLAADGGARVAITLDLDGVPTDLGEARSWPMELEPTP